MKLIQLVILCLALTVHLPMYGQGITIRQKLEELQKLSSIHVVYDSKLDLNAPAKSIKWVKLGNNIMLIPISSPQKDPKSIHQKAKCKKYTISGYVKDESDEVLVNASIYDQDAKVGVMTNEHGFFSLTLPEGIHHLEFSFLGLSKEHKEIKLNKDCSLQIRLQEDNTLGEVVVCADLNSQLLNTQMGKRTFSQEDFHKGFSFMSSPDILKALQQISGTASGIELSSGLYVHGGESDENLFLLDDSPLYQINHSLGLFSSFNTDLVKNVDFYKSGFPARFNGRLSSITDVRTLDGNPKKLHGSFSLGLLDGKISLEGPIVKDKTTFAFGMRRSWLDLITHPIFSIINHGKKDKFTMGYLFYDLNAKVTHHMSENNKVYLSLYSGQDKYNTCNREIYDSDLSEDDNDFQWGNTNISLGWNQQINSKLYFNLIGTFSHNNTLQEYIDKEESRDYSHSQSDYVSTTYQEGHSRIYDTGVKTDIEYHPNSHHKIKAGISGTFHYFTTKTTQQLAYQDFIEESGDTSKTWSRSIRHSFEMMLFGEEEWLINRHWSCHFGINFSRFQIEGKSYNRLDPRWAMKYQPSHWISLKASYTRMSQYVHRIASSYLDMPTDYWIPTTSKIRPAHASQFALGIYMQPSLKWQMNIEGFYKRSHHLLQYQNYMGLMPSATRWEKDVMEGKGKAYGIEWDAQYCNKRITLNGTYTLSWSKRLFDKISDQWFRDKFDNRHKLNLSMVYRLSHTTDFNAVWIYHSGNRLTLPTSSMALPNLPGSTPSYDSGYHYTTPNNAAMPAYHRLDLGFNFHHPLKRGGERIWNISIYNAYCHLNTMYVEIKQDDYWGGFHAKCKGYIPIIPSVSYTWKF